MPKYEDPLVTGGVASTQPAFQAWGPGAGSDAHRRKIAEGQCQQQVTETEWEPKGPDALVMLSGYFVWRCLELRDADRAGI